MKDDRRCVGATDAPDVGEPGTPFKNGGLQRAKGADVSTTTKRRPRHTGRVGLRITARKRSTSVSRCTCEQIARPSPRSTKTLGLQVRPASAWRVPRQTEQAKRSQERTITSPKTGFLLSTKDRRPFATDTLKPSISRESCPGKFRLSEFSSRSKPLKGVQFLEIRGSPIVGRARIPRTSRRGRSTER